MLNSWPAALTWTLLELRRAWSGRRLRRCQQPRQGLAVLAECYHLLLEIGFQVVQRHQEGLMLETLFQIETLRQSPRGLSVRNHTHRSLLTAHRHDLNGISSST